MSRGVVVVCLLVCATLACSAPPEKEHHQAEGALSAARAADAAIYAPTELSAAESALSQYDAAVAQHDYRQALRLAVEARDGAYEAAKQAANAKAAARGNAERLLSELNSLNGVAEARLRGTATPRLTGVAAERVRTTLKDSSAALQKARSDVAAQQYQAATDRLTPLLARLRTDLEAPAPAPIRRR